MAKLKDRKKKLKVLSGETQKEGGETREVDQSDIRDESQENGEHWEKKKLSKMKRKKSQSEGNGFAEDVEKVNEVDESTKRRPKKRRSKEKKALVDETDTEIENKLEHGNVLIKGESKKSKRKKRNQLPTEAENILTKRDGGGDEIHQISSGDEDCSKGMRKWITEYHQQRPGLKELQERIDDYITAHEKKEEEEKQEREALAGDDGWIVVTHHKGRKKTTDAETGVVVGSVTQAAVLDKMAKKKNKDVGHDFYRFQRREAHKNEILMLQSKFEQDKKRIQQLRAARKFRPY